MHGGHVLDAEFIEDVDTIGTPLGPAIVFRKMVETGDYLSTVTANGIDAWRRQMPSMKEAGILADKQGEWFYGTLNVSGWHKNEEQSFPTRQKFEELARPFFPDAPGRDAFMGDLSRTIGRFAAAANARDLFITFSAEQRSMAYFPPDFAFEHGERTHGHLQLAGSSLFIVPPQHYPGNVWQHALANELSLEEKTRLMFDARVAEPLDLIAWQGRNGRYPVLTAETPRQGEFRLHMGVTPMGQRAAHSFPANFIERFSDRKKTSDFAHS